MKIPIKNLYYLLCYASGQLERLELVGAAALDRFERVEDLLGKVLAEGTFHLIRQGIDRGYREITEEIPGVRGKLLVGAMATRAVRARGRTICTFEEFSPDVLHNRILRSSLALLLRSDGLTDRVRSDVSLAHQKLDGIQVVRLNRKLFRQVQLDRNQRFYGFLLSICELVVESALVGEESGQLHFHDFRRDEKRMWKVFEDFALEFYRAEQSRFHVTGQRHVPWDRPLDDERPDYDALPVMQSDITLVSDDRRIVLDTKFYQEPLSSHHGARKLRSGNLYQLLTYLGNRQARLPEGPRHEGILLYAAVKESFRIDVDLQGFRVQARTVDLDRPWQDVREEMLEVLEPEYVGHG